MENFVSLTHLCPCNVFSSCSLPLLPPLVPDSVDLRPWSDSTPNQNGGRFAQKANCRSVYLRDLKNVIFFFKENNTQHEYMPGGLVCLLRLRLFYHSPAHPFSGNIAAHAPCAACSCSGSASLEEFWLPAWQGEIFKFFLKFRMNFVQSSAKQLAVGSFTHSSPRCLPQPDSAIAAPCLL